LTEVNVRVIHQRDLIWYKRFRSVQLEQGKGTSRAQTRRSDLGGRTGGRL
jgi:hypothetical protein